MSAEDEVIGFIEQGGLFTLNADSLDVADQDNIALLDTKIADLDPTDHFSRFQASFFISVYGKNSRYAKQLLLKARQLLDQALTLSPNNATYKKELARQMLSSGEFSGAKAIFTDVSSSFSDFSLSLQTVRCSVATAERDNDLTAVEQAVDTIYSLVDTESPPSELYIALGDICQFRVARGLTAAPSPSSPLATSMSALHWYTLASETLVAGLKASPARFEAVRLADIGCDVLEQMEAVIPTGTPPTPAAEKTLSHLTSAITATLGAIPRIQTLSAKLASSLGRLADVRKALAGEALEPFLMPEIFVLLAQAELELEMFTAAEESLVRAAGLVVAGDPAALAVATQLAQAKGKYGDSIPPLERKLAAVINPSRSSTMMGKVVRRGGRTFSSDVVASKGGVKDPEPKADLKIPISVEIRLFLQLRSAYSHTGRVADAESTKAIIMERYEGTNALDLVRVSDAKDFLDANNVADAITALKMVPRGSTSYVTATELLATTLLTRRNDRDGYIQCYREVVEAAPTVDNLRRLGAAFTKAGRFTEAIDIFHQIESDHPGVMVTQEICAALVATRRVDEARQVYHDALFGQNTAPLSDVRRAYIRLLLDLDEFDVAAEQAALAVAVHSTLEDSAAGVEIADFSELLSEAKSHTTSGTRDVSAIQALDRGKAMLQMTARERIVDPTVKSLYRTRIADLCLALRAQSAAWIASGRPIPTTAGRPEFDTPKVYLETALKECPQHVPSLLAKAEDELHRGHLKACRTACDTIIMLEPGHPGGTVMLARAAVEAGNSEEAVKSVRALVDGAGGGVDWGLVIKLIRLLRRGAKDTESAEFVGFDPSADEDIVKGAHTGGFYMARGMYLKYTQRNEAALLMLDKARVDPVWKSRAMVEMAHIYLNPSCRHDMGALEEGRKTRGPPRPETSNSRHAAGLIGKLKGMLSEADHICLEARLAILRGQDTEELLRAMNGLQAQDMSNVRLHYHRALVQAAQGKTPTVRSTLKQVKAMNKESGSSVPTEYIDDFVAAMLVLADTYLSAKKHSVVETIINEHVLPFDPHRARAQELLGIVKEKESAYDDALEHYEIAWGLVAHKSPEIGFRLAFNYEKAGRPVDCINVLEVLRKLGNETQQAKKLRDAACRGIRT